MLKGVLLRMLGHHRYMLPEPLTPASPNVVLIASRVMCPSDRGQHAQRIMVRALGLCRQQMAACATAELLRMLLVLGTGLQELRAAADAASAWHRACACEGDPQL